MSSKNINIIVIILTLIFLSVKLTYFFNVNKNPEILSYPDEKNYYESGANALKEQGFSYFLTKRSLHNGPLNILWVYIHPNYTSVKVANIILMSLASLLLYFAFTSTFSHFTRILAWLIFSAYPLINHYSGTILTEPPFIFLLMLSTFLFFKAKDNYFIYFLSGIFFALATLVRPTTQYFPFFLIGIYLLIFLLNKLSISNFRIEKKITYSFVSFILGTLLLTTPWVIKNKILFNKLGIATGSGAVIYLGNDHRKDGDEPIYSNMHFDTFEITKPFSHLDLEGDKKLTNAALSIIKEYPIDFLIISAKKSLKLLFGYPMDYFERRTNIIDFQTHPRNKTYYANLLELVLHVFLSVSFLYFLFTKSFTSTSTIFISNIFLYFLCLHSVSFPIPRLFLPAVIFSIFTIPYVLNSFWRMSVNSFLSVIVILFISLFYVNPTNAISKRREKFFKKDNIVINNEEISGFTKAKDFYVSKNSKEHSIILSINNIKTTFNKIFLINLNHIGQNKDKKVSNLKIFWDSGNGFNNKDKLNVRFSTNKEALYLTSPTISFNDWNNGLNIKKVKLTFSELTKGDKLKLNLSIAK